MKMYVAQLSIKPSRLISCFTKHHATKIYPLLNWAPHHENESLA